MFLFFCSHVHLKIWFVSGFLYLSICVHTSTCSPKIPAKVKIFLSTVSLQRTTTDSCFCCSVVFCSQILTGIEKVNNEAATIFKGKKCIFFVRCTRDVCFFFFLRGEGGVDDEAPVTTVDQNFCCLASWEIHNLIC